MFKIFCQCGACIIEIYNEKPTLHLLCGCEDCRQALEWGAINGAPRPSLLPSLFYLKSDIRKVKGRDKMNAVQLRQGARSTRVYCQECYSVLGVDHPAYLNNVFMFFKNHCGTNFKLPDKAVAAIYLDDLPPNASHLIPNDIPLFYSFPREREKFRSINAVSNSFKEPKAPPIGYSFGDLIKSLGQIQVLQLEQGKPV